jgi:hypothetical protein
MLRLRYWSVLMACLFFAGGISAQEKQSSPWFIDRTLTVTPMAAPTPALKYRLLPLGTELKEGNAVPIYLRLVHEQSDASKKYWTETPQPWNEQPVDKIPLEEAQKFMDNMRGFLRQFEVGARRRKAEWNYTLDEPNPIGLLLPDVQVMRNYAPMLILQARVALAKGDFALASHHMATGLAFCRHVAEGPTLIHGLVGFAIASQYVRVLGDFVEQPDAPNLYWALTALPRPFINLNDEYDSEYRLLEWQFPDLGDLDRPRPPEQWDEALRQIRIEIRAAATRFEGEKSTPKLPDYFPKDYLPEEPAAKSKYLPAAQEYVARTKKLSAEKVAAMPPAQVLLIYMAGTYHEFRDDVFKAIYLPYADRQAVYDAAHARLEAAMTSEGHLVARLFLPALKKVGTTQTRFERNIAALRIVEALRIYAASHDGKLPEKLADVTEVPVPKDPSTGQPFEYSRDGEAAVLVSQGAKADAALPSNGIRYKITVRKK